MTGNLSTEPVRKEGAWVSRRPLSWYDRVPCDILHKTEEPNMLPDHIRLKTINHITYNVKDKEAALKWYCEVLGLGQIPKMVNSTHLYWLQLPSGAMVHIIENPDAPSAPSHHTAFEVDDLEAAHAYMISKGVVPTAIQTRNDGQKAFYINDPDGNRIELCTKSGFGVLV